MTLSLDAHEGENGHAFSGLAVAAGAWCAWALPGSLLLRWRSMSLRITHRRDPRADDEDEEEEVDEDEDEREEAVTGEIGRAHV